MSWLFGRGNPQVTGAPIEADIANQLNDLLQDSPSSREKISSLENRLRDSTQALRRLVKISKQYQSIGNAFKDIANVFGNELLSFNFDGLPSTATTVQLPQLVQCIGQTIIDINDYQNMLMVQMGNVFIQPLEQFLQGELKATKQQTKQYNRLRTKYDQSISKFSHIKKTDLEKIPEAEHELMCYRNEYQRSSLEYVSLLGKLESETKLQVMERACAFLYSEKAYFSQGFLYTTAVLHVYLLHQIGLTIHAEIDKKLSNLSREITETHKIIDLRSDMVLRKLSDLQKLEIEGSPLTPSREESGMETAGYLFLKTGKNWKRGYFEVKNGSIYGQKNTKDESKEMANLLVCTVRRADARDVDRRFCFEVVSPNERFVFQAENEEILQHWTQIIQNAIGHALNYNSPNLKKSGVIRADAMSSSNSFLAQLRKNEANRYCADCGEESPTWASINLGILICISCSGIHRELGTHISRVRSTTLDTWDLELQKMFFVTGNELAKSVFEKNVPEGVQSPDCNSSREDKRKWIVQKYIEKKWVAQPKLGSHGTLQLALHAAVQDSDLEAALTLIIHGADINWKNPDHLYFSALHYAVTEGQASLCDLLLQNGADPNIVDGSGWTPLHHCAYLNKIDCVILLIRRGAKLGLVDNQKKTPLDIAVLNVQAHCVTLLRLALHAEEEAGSALEDEAFAIALHEFSEEVEEMMTVPTKPESLWTTQDIDSDDEISVDSVTSEVL